jgi:hypothetical protein
MSDPYRTAAPSSPGSGDALHDRLAEALPEAFGWARWDVAVIRRAATALLPVVEAYAAQKAAEAETTLERVRALLQKAEWQEKHSIARMFDGAPFPVSISQHDLRAALSPATEKEKR